MKISIKHIIMSLSAALLLFNGGCAGNFEDKNTNHNNLYVVPPAMLLTQMIYAMMNVQQNDSQMIDQMVGTSGGYMALGQRWGGTNFDTFNPSDGWNAEPWNANFLDIYANFFKIEEASNGTGHFWAMARLTRAAVMCRLADCYGPMPYSKVVRGNFYTPYDSAEEVYTHILEDLTYAAATLAEFVTLYPEENMLGANDPLYAGDYTKWAKLANSLRMRIAMRIGDSEAFIAAMNDPAGTIDTNADNAKMDCGKQRNPYDLAADSWGDLRAASSIVDYMLGYGDPRTEKYFTPSQVGGQTYVGLPVGLKVLEKSQSGPYSQPKFGESERLPVFNASETAFLKAEAALRNWIGGDARTFYEQGITLSMEDREIPADAKDAYIADSESTPAGHSSDPMGNDYNRKTTVKIAWDAETSQEKHLEQIITQKWIANYPMGLEAWAEFRRTGYPELQPTVDDLSGECPDLGRGLRRLKFPYTEKSMNGTNYTDGVTKLGEGGDSFFTDLFWAKKK